MTSVLSFVPTAQAVTAPVVTRTTFFNDPVTGVQPAPGAPSAITAAIVAFLQRAYEGSRVDIAMYQMSNVDWVPTLAQGQPDNPTTDMRLIANAIKNAADAGAHFNIVIDSGDYNNGIVREIAGYPRVYVHECAGGCYTTATGGVMHNKFMIANTLLAAPRTATTATSAAATISYAVLQMTSNWTNKQLSSHFFNSAIEFDNDANLYQGYENYWVALWGCAGMAGNKCSQAAPSTLSFSGSGGESVSLFPRSGTADPVLTQLGNVSCPSTIDIVVNLWAQNDGRGGALESKLASLHAAGCAVRVVVPDDRVDPSADSIVPAMVRDFGVMAHCSGYSGDGQEDGNITTSNVSSATPSIHSKYMLVAGTYGNVAGSSMVFTGSETFSEKARAGSDNAWVTVKTAPGDPETYAAYEANFNDIWASTPPCGQDNA